MNKLCERIHSHTRPLLLIRSLTCPLSLTRSQTVGIEQFGAEEGVSLLRIFFLSFLLCLILCCVSLRVAACYRLKGFGGLESTGRRRENGNKRSAERERERVGERFRGVNLWQNIFSLPLTCHLALWCTHSASSCRLGC